MRWQVIRTIWFREVSDQLRDRRTLVLLLVMPVVLYPLLGLLASYFLILFVEQPVVVGVAGHELLEQTRDLGDKPLPALIRDDRFAPSLFPDSKSRDLIHVRLGTEDDLLRQWEQGNLDALIVFDHEWLAQLARGGQPTVPVRLRGQEADRSQTASLRTADDRGQIAYDRLMPVLRAWRQAILRQRLEALGAAPAMAEPFRIPPLALDSDFGLARVFPFLIVMMALTGALYPAIDLCAGEKERGTMETLLISPAERSEIVAGKFLTVWLFSSLSAVLNLASLGFSAWQFSSALAGQTSEPLFTTPSGTALACGLAVLLPLAAFFSAICLATAVYARSTREGQYYLVPLTLVALLLTLVSVMPGTELTPFTSLVPVVGPSLVLQELIAARSWQEAPWVYLVPVLLATLGYCYLALVWAGHQFQRESVLFREAERVELGLLLRQWLDPRRSWPTPGRAAICFAAMLALQWYVGMATAAMSPMLSAVLVQGVAILAPPLVLTLVLTSRPWQTLHAVLSCGTGAVVRLRGLSAWLGLALVLAWSVHGPLVVAVKQGAQQLPSLAEHLRNLELRFSWDEPIWWQCLALGLVPALCEEFAFRGYILAGLRQGLGTRPAILLSSVLFALAHGDPFRLIPTFLLGLLLALLASRCGSLVPGILLHASHNMLALMMGWRERQAQAGRAETEWWAVLDQFLYSWPALGTAAAVLLAGVAWLAWQRPVAKPSGLEHGDGHRRS